MSKDLPKITLLFAGGASLQLEDKEIISVLKEADVAAWIDEFPELRLIADIEPVFVFPDGKEISSENWNTLSKEIADRYNSSDGFVVLHPLDSMLYTSSALSFLLGNLSKPVVFTGSPLAPHMKSEKDIEGFMSHYRTLGVRANLINAIQVATMNVPEVTILFGNQLLRANRARKSLSTSFNFFDTDESDILGTVDFGIKLKDPKRKATKEKLQLGSLNDPYLALVRIHPDYRQEEFADVLKEKPDGILIQTYLQSGIKENLKPYIQIAYQQGIPIVVFNPFIADIMNVKGVYVATDISYEALYSKFLWALSSGKSAQEILKLLDKNIAHEFAKEKEGSV